MKHRKEKEAPPPHPWLRSRGGTPAKIVKTTKTSPAGTWYYRLDFGDVIGTQLWTLAELIADKVRWLKNQPPDWQLGAWRNA